MPPFFVELRRLVIDLTLYFSNVFGQSDNLLRITKFIIIPGVEHHILSIRRNDRCVRVVD